MTRAPFTFTYYTVQQPFVEELEGLLREWWAVVEADTGLAADLEIAIMLDPDAEQVEWTTRTDRAVDSIPCGRASRAVITR